MAVLRVDGISKEIQGRRIFSNVCLEVHSGERVALIGRNGVGKTTLLKCLMGNLDVDKGSIHRGIGLSDYGMMEQHAEIPEYMSLFDYVFSAKHDLYEAKQSLLGLEKRVAESSTHESLFSAYAEALNHYLKLDGYGQEVDAGNVLRRMQFPESSWTKPYVTLSGGEKTRAQLARLMVLRPKFLLLDEPTNHLDAEMLDWVEAWVRQYRGTVLFVSHDRHFIDAVATSTYELTDAGLNYARGGYTAYRVKQNSLEQSRQAIYDKKEKERQALISAIQRYREWFQKGHDAASERDPYAKKRAAKNANRFQAKTRALKQLEERSVEKPKKEMNARIDFRDGQFNAKHMITLDHVSFSFEADYLYFSLLNLSVNRGDRIAVMGQNGAGKSTLLRLLIADLTPDCGHILRHPELRVGYFAQQVDVLPMDRSILACMLELPGITQSLARTILAGFLFSSEDVHKMIGDLSMGERCRVAFVLLYFSRANLLVLDEPTNYLDIGTRERMEVALAAYPGSVILVSHDRYLVQKVANRIWEIQEGVVRDFHGTLDAYRVNLETGTDRRDDPERDNEIRKLRYELALYLSGDEPTNEDAKIQWWADLQERRRRLRELAGKE